MSNWIDLGHDHAYSYSQWAPDRELNPQYDGIPDIPRCGVLVHHFKPGTTHECMGFIYFNTPEVRAMRSITNDQYPMWDLLSYEPLHVEPSLACVCGDHGFIRDGKWVPA